jgi:hypothetical protein
MLNKALDLGANIFEVLVFLAGVATLLAATITVL